jgi:hypothetical protein
MENWGVGYLAGWVGGTYLMWRVGLVDNLFGYLYTIVGLHFLFAKIVDELR